MRLSVATWRWLLAGSFLFGAATHAPAQVAPAAATPHGYDFLTVTTFEGVTKASSKLLLTPAFQGKSEIQLEDLSGSSFARAKDLAIAQRNTLLINQQLSVLTTEGWELMQVYAVTALGEPSTRYLFRKPRP